MKNLKTSCHRSDKLDAVLGEDVTIHFTDGEVAFGTLKWNPSREMYTLCRYWAEPNIVFRKSIVRKVVV